jgi:ABC-2 type transport system ATP-binding protein/lipopolysaccharide transport system ATP-binding protein
MAYISLKDATVEFPLYTGGSRSLKKQLLRVGARRKTISTRDDRVIVRALDNVTLDLVSGDRVGLVGHNGAGKTTILRVLAGIYEPVQGSFMIEGRVCSLLNVGLGLDPDVSGYENIILQGMYLGYRPSEMREKIDEIAAFTELESFLSMPVRTYSSGMALRLAFAVATAVRPEILLMDEWVLAGDGRFMEKARRRIEEFTKTADILVLASHSMEILRQWCDRILWLDGGKIRMDGPTEEVLAQYEASMQAPTP